ncbi:Kv channel-interacting protein 4 [Sarracenia purpurea var. burkii]
MGSQMGRASPTHPNPSLKKERTHVTLVVQSELGELDIYFRVRLTAPLRQLKLAYCDRVGLDRDDLRFTYDGAKLKDDQTAAELEMEDGDVVDVWSDQTGGAGGGNFATCVVL